MSKSYIFRGQINKHEQKIRIETSLVFERFQQLWQVERYDVGRVESNRFDRMTAYFHVRKAFQSQFTIVILDEFTQ